MRHNTEKQNKTRELTASESCICILGVIAIFLLAAVPTNDYSVIAFVRYGLSILLGVYLVIWQQKRINTPIKDKDNGK